AVFKLLRFIHHQITERCTGEQIIMSHKHTIGSQYDGSRGKFSNFMSISTMIDVCFTVWRKLLVFIIPVKQQRGRYRDQTWFSLWLQLVVMLQQGYDLYRFSKPHIVG